jgi:hypothetical protein
MVQTKYVSIRILGVALIVAYHVIFQGYFPNIHGKMGHDYALFLPKLLDGYFWFSTNGLFALPWFTPSFCGGIPLFPDPQSMYYSIPQFLSFFIDPLASVYITVILFALLGYTGFYLLLSRIFLTSPWMAVLGAGLFLFNGFYVHRMIIGHLTYHPFMLIPLLAFFLLRAVPALSTAQRGPRGLHAAMAGILLAYMFQAGMVNVALPAIVSVIIIGLIYEMTCDTQRQFWRRLTSAGGIALALCGAKLVAAMAYLQHFGRDMYQLPGTRTLTDAMLLVLQVLFIAPTTALTDGRLVNVQWGLDRHEFEFGVTFVPLVWLATGGMAVIYRAWTQGVRYRSTPGQWLRLALIAGLLFLPICLNYYTPTWNALLKHIPILRNSASLLRWVSLYIPVVILLTALAGESLLRVRAYSPYAPYAVGASLTVVVMLNMLTDRQFYHAQTYVPDQILQAYYEFQQGRVPGITNIAVYTDPLGRAIMPQRRNDTFVQGSSQLLCYEPLFGYRLEKFPIKTLHVGPVLVGDEGYLNLKNPACYVYPLDNACAPGDHFLVEQLEIATAFSAYKPIPFRLPIWQRAAHVLNLFAIVCIARTLLVSGCQRCSEWWKSQRESRGKREKPARGCHLQ